MQASAYPNLTTARVSGDRFDRNVWWNFLFASRLASALGIYPFTDVFMSSEADNLLMAVLSAGPVGIGDAVGRIDVAGLLRAVRPDGVIVKPDVPLAPLDSTYIREWKGLKAPVVASTYTDALDFRTHYVFAFSQGDDIVASFHTSELGVTGTAYVYDYLTGLGRLVGPSDLVSQPMPAGKAFFVVAPIGPSGVALIGDQGHFVTMGSRRVTSAFDDGAAHMTVAFTSGETVRTIRGYAPRLPLVTATEGAAAPVQYDTTSQQFTVDLWPGPGLTASVKIEISGFAHRGRPDPSGSDPDRTRRHSASPRRQSR